jgi:methylmalonyl-CoA mutase N-terminal domain/subunit
VKSLAEVKRKRDEKAVSRCLEALSASAASLISERHERSHMMPLIIDAVRARCTTGEISDTLESQWGAYSPGM